MFRIKTVFGGCQSKVANIFNSRPPLVGNLCYPDVGTMRRAERDSVRGRTYSDVKEQLFYVI